MLATRRGQPGVTRAALGPAVVAARSSGQCRTASSVHWIEVWCSLFFFTPTVARQSRQATSVSRAAV